jgi:hypothetical protein
MGASGKSAVGRGTSLSLRNRKDVLAASDLLEFLLDTLPSLHPEVFMQLIWRRLKMYISNKFLGDASGARATLLKLVQSYNRTRMVYHEGS